MTVVLQQEPGGWFWACGQKSFTQLPVAALPPGCFENLCRTCHGALSHLCHPQAKYLNTSHQGGFGPETITASQALRIWIERSRDNTTKGPRWLWPVGFGAKAERDT